MTIQIDDDLPATGARTPISSGRMQAAAQSHRLRMCLDLQMDALRAAFAAATCDCAGSTPPGSGDVPIAVPVRPWQRWLMEDLDQAFTLAAIRAAGGSEAGQGGRPGSVDLAGSQTALRSSLADLTIHYQSMRDLLGELVDGPSRLSPGPTHAAAVLARQRCESRLRELRAAMISTIERG